MSLYVRKFCASRGVEGAFLRHKIPSSYSSLADKLANNQPAPLDPKCIQRVNNQIHWESFIGQPLIGQNYLQDRWLMAILNSLG